MIIRTIIFIGIGHSGPPGFNPVLWVLSVRQELHHIPGLGVDVDLASN